MGFWGFGVGYMVGEVVVGVVLVMRWLGVILVAGLMLVVVAVRSIKKLFTQ